MRDKKIYIVIISLVIISIFAFVKFKKGEDIKNYPSGGTHIIAFGDSLVYGVGASSRENNFVSILSKRIGEPIINLGVSGNTTGDGLSRIKELDGYDPKIVILLLGGNDYLRKIPKEETFNNLAKIIENIQSRGAIVLLLGVRGGIVSDEYKNEFEILSKKYKTAYVPNVLSGLLTNQKYMADAIHPNDEGYRIIADKIYPVLKKVMD